MSEARGRWHVAMRWILRVITLGVSGVGAYLLFEGLDSLRMVVAMLMHPGSRAAGWGRGISLVFTVFFGGTGLLFAASGAVMLSWGWHMAGSLWSWRFRRRV